MKLFLIGSALCLLPVSAAAEDLKEFLGAATELSHPNVPLRADGEVVVTSPESTNKDQIIIVAQTNGDVYVETKNAGTKALLHPIDNEAYLLAKKGATEKKVALEDSFKGTDLSWEDLLPFNAASWEFPVIIDKSADLLTVQLTPKRKQYILVVMTFDREKRVPTKTLYYVEKASNLVKMRTDSDFQQIDGQWLPGKISVKTFALRTETTLTLQWRKATDLPDGLFLSGSLERDSGLRFAQPAQP